MLVTPASFALTDDAAWADLVALARQVLADGQERTAEITLQREGQTARHALAAKIGRASCRERV